MVILEGDNSPDEALMLQPAAEIKEGILTRTRGSKDTRQMIITLTKKGFEQFADQLTMIHLFLCFLCISM